MEWRGFGMAWVPTELSDDGEKYIPVVENKAGDFPFAGGDAPILDKGELGDIEVIAMKDYSSSSSSDTGGFPLTRYSSRPKEWRRLPRRHLYH